jgi:tryptophan synthase alpha chain
MAHMVAGFPTRELSFEVARGIIDGGATYLEVQFPFSDPTADGPVIQAACTDALDGGFTLESCFGLIEEVREYSTIPVFIMSYASPVVAVGVERFVQRAKRSGAEGLIVPDLAPLHDEGLYTAGEREAVQIVPVVVPSMQEERLAEVAALHPAYIYAALRTGVTGEETGLEPAYRYLESLSRTVPNAKLFAGFGVRTREQVRALSSCVHAAVIGTAFVQAVRKAACDTLYHEIREAVRYFV